MGLSMLRGGLLGFEGTIPRILVIEKDNVGESSVNGKL